MNTLIAVGTGAAFIYSVIAEESGFIVELGEFVIASALAQCRRWRAEGLASGRLAINLSMRQLADRELAGRIAGAVAAHGLQPGDLEFELTETAAMEQADFVLPQLAALAAAGFTLALDDFGTGYSSLSYLSRFNVDKLKIDRSFIIGSPANEEDNAIVRMITQMAHVLRLRAVAEGVETPAQLAFLRHSGCDVAQGYLISRPLEPAAYHRFARIPHSTSLLDWHL